MREEKQDKPHTVETLVQKYRSLDQTDEGAEIKFDIESKILLHPVKSIIVFVSKSLLVIIDMQGDKLKKENETNQYSHPIKDLEDKEVNLGECQLNLIMDSQHKFDTYQLRYNTGPTEKDGNQFKIINVTVDLEHLEKDLE